MQSIETKLIESVMAAKGSVLKSVIEQIEGRHSTIEDAKNITLASFPGSGNLLSEYFLYKGVLIGIIETDFATATITFSPKTQEDQPTQNIVVPRKLVHSGKQRSYPSSYVWDCPKCNSWNIWATRKFWGYINVVCQECKNEFILDKENVILEVTRTKKDKSIID